jgi:multidrug efflux system membrane fusion protein
MKLLARKPVIRLGLSLAAVLGLGVVFISCSGAGSKSAQGPRGPMAMPVSVATVEQRDLPVYLNGLGTVTAFNTVTLKSRLDGQLVKVAFREGQEVRAGDLLAVIDPRPYDVALAQAQATLYKDQASLKDARVNLQRDKDLFKEGVIPQQQLDTQDSLVGQLEGAVRADQAAVDNAKLNLTYTRIIAPVSGRVGLRMVDIGNMIHATDPNGLLVITQLRPIAVIFTLPEDKLPVVASHMKNGTLQVEAYDRDNLVKLATGKLLTIDNQIDTTTGTGRLKAVFDNRDNALWPNQFVNIRLQIEVRKDAKLVPAAVVQRGPQGMFAYVVKADKTVEVRPISVSITQGGLAAVDSGLNAGEIVVTDGQDKLQPGGKVEPRATRGAGGTAGQTAAPASGSSPNLPAPPPATTGASGGPGMSGSALPGQTAAGASPNKRGPAGTGAAPHQATGPHAPQGAERQAGNPGR